MFTSIANPSKWTTTAAIALFGLLLGTEAQAAGSSTSTDGPMIKNVMALTYRAPSVQPDQSRGLTKREVKRLSAAAESANDHLMLAAYYRAEAERLDAQASGYERAAATYRNGPMVENLMAPSTLDRYEFLAKGLRDESRSDRTLATAQEEMAKEAGAAL